MMKGVILSICVFICCSTLGLAQAKIRLGVDGGINYANFSVSGFDPRMSFVAGVTSEFKLKDRIYLKADLHFERKRATREFSYLQVDPQDPAAYTRFREYIQHDYLVLPVQVKFELGKHDPFYLSAGVFMAYALKADYFSDTVGTMGGEYSSDFATMDYGLVLGVGKAFEVGKTQRLNVEIRENYGIPDVNNSTYNLPSGVTTNSLNLLVGYSFDLK